MPFFARLRSFLGWSKGYHRGQRRTYRPRLLAEELEQRQLLSVVGEFPGQGLLRYRDAGGWQSLTATAFAQVGVDTAGDVVGTYAGQGVWRYQDSTGWRQLTATDFTQVSIAGNGIVVGAYHGQGVWRFEDSTGWRQLTTNDFSQVGVDAAGDVVGTLAGKGVWRYEDSTGWQQLSASAFTQVSIAGNGIVVGAFPGQGLWRFEDSTGWRQLTATDFSQLGLDAAGDVVGAFRGQGLWRFEDSTGWRQLTATDFTQVGIAGNGTVVGAFAGQGVWRFQDSTGWQQLTAKDPSQLHGNADPVTVVPKGRDAPGSAPGLTLNATYNLDGTVTLAGQVTDDSPANLPVTFSGPVNAQVSTAADGSFSYTTGAWGPGDQQASVTDASGQTATSAVVTLNATTPSAFTLAAAYNPDGSVTLTGQVTADLPDNLIVTLWGAVNAQATTDANGAFSYTTTSWNLGNVNAYATNALGESSPSATVPLSAAAPVVTLSAACNPDGTVTLAGLVTDAFPQTFTVTLTGAVTAAVPTAADGSFSYTTAAWAVGNVQAATADSWGQGSNSAQVSLTQDPPVLTVSAAHNADGSLTLSGQVVALAPGNLTVTFAGAVNDQATTAADGSFSLSPASWGPGTVQVSTVTAQGQSSTPAVLTLSQTGPAIAFSAAHNADGSVTLSGQVTDDAPDNFTVALTGTVNGQVAAAADGSFSYTTSAWQPGAVQASTTDSGGQSAGTVLTLNPAPPVLTLHAGYNGDGSVILSGQAAAANPANLAVAFTGAVTAQATTAADGSFSIIAPAWAPGDVQAVATDAWGQGSNLAVVTLSQTATPPTATFASSGPVVVGSPATVSFTGASGGSGGYTYSYDFADNGTFEIAGSSSAQATVPAAYLPTAGQPVIHGRITDASGGFTDYTTTVLVTSLPVNTQPTATFGNSGPVDLGSAALVFFSGAAGGSGHYTYSYDFANTGTFQLVNTLASLTSVAASTLSTVGPHVVHGRITDSSGRYSDYTTTVTVNALPTATFANGGAVDVGSPATVSFTAPAGGTGGYTYSYDFANNGTFEVTSSTATQATVPASFLSTVGAHVVHGRISDASGGFTDYTTTVTVNALPTATFTSSGVVNQGGLPVIVTGAVDEGGTLFVYFVGQAGGTGSFTYSFDFGNTGTFEITNSPSLYVTVPESYVDDGPGTLVVHGRVTDATGGYTDYTTSIKINNVPPTAAFGNNGPVSVGNTATVSFTNQADPSHADTAAGFKYSYDFANNGTFEITDSTASVATVPASYLTIGTHVVKGRIKDKDGGYADYTTTITVTTAPTATFASGGAVNEGSTGTVSFTNPAGGSGGYTYSYDFGNTGTFEITGSTSASATVPASYLADGPATLVVHGRIIDSSGAFTDYTTSITIKDVPPSVNAATSLTAIQGATTLFGLGTFSDPGVNDGPWTVAVNWGDATSSSFTATPGALTGTHTYANAGSYTATVTVTNNDGVTGSGTIPMTIVNPPPTATLSSNGPVYAGNPVTASFSNASDSSAAETAAGFHYSFAQSQGALATTYASAGTSSSGSITFPTGGTYPVYGRIFAQDNGYTDYSTQVTILNVGQLPVTLTNTPGDPGSAVTFLANVSGATTGAVTYHWVFGDGGTQSTSSPLVSYSYAAAGNYTASVTISDAANHSGAAATAVTVSSTTLQDVTLDGTSFALAGSPVSFSVGNPNPPPSGGFTYHWNFGDGSTDTTTVPTDSHAYGAAGNYAATVSVSDSQGDNLVSSAGVTVNPATDTSDPLFTPVVSSTSFSYLGSFALPRSANNWDTAYSYGGLTYRYVNGNLQFFTTNHVYSGGLVYEFNYPGISTNPSNLPQAQVVNNWGDIYTGQKLDDNYGGFTGLSSADPTYGLYYDQASNRLYWNYGDWYNASYPYQQSIGYSTLNDATVTATGAGAWSLTGRPEKFDRGGMVQIPQWFANRYTGGDTLGVGFGGYFSIAAGASFGPALAAIAPPNPAVNPDDSSLPNMPLLGYPVNAPDRAHRDTNYVSYYDSGTYPTTPGRWNPANGTGYWTWSDTIFDGGTWINTPQMQGVLFIAKVGQGNVYYQSSDRHAQSGSFEWMVYNPADLAAVASGAKQQWQIQPEYEWTTPTLPFGPFDQANGNGYTGDGESNVGGVVFDPTTNRLYVLMEGAIANPSEAWPEMYVYQVGPPPSATTPGNSFVVADTQSGFSTTGTGWANLPSGYGGEQVQMNSAAPGTATATWQATGLAAGWYTLSVDWNAQPNSNTSAAVYKIYDGSTVVQTITVNQQVTPSGQVVDGPLFQSLGTFDITTGNLKVVIASQASGTLAADALFVQPASAT